MPNDKWGIPFFYATKKTAGLSGKSTGFFWQQNNNIHKDDDYEGTAFLRIGKEHDSSDFKVISTTTGEWQFPFTASDGLSLSGPTGHHTGGETHGCQGFTYMIDVDVRNTPADFRFRKETYHVQYDDHPQGRWTHPLVNYKIIGSGWNGYGWVRYNKKDGRGSGKDSVICECWWNPHPDTDITDWTMLKRVEDKGHGVTNWGVSATCDGEAHQVGTWSNIQFRFKMDASDFSLHPLIPEPDNGPHIDSIGGEDMSFSDSESRGYGKRADMPRDIEMKCLFKYDADDGKMRFKNVSLREIDPSISFDDNTGGGTPDVPPVDTGGGGSTGTSTIQGTFKIQWDVNNLRTSACAGAGGATFYDNIPSDGIPTTEKVLGTAAAGRITKAGQQILLSSDNQVGKTIKQLDLPLKKTGTPAASPVINARIWTDGGTVLYTSPTTIDPTTLTTSYVTTTFDFSTNTHVFVTGDRIGIEYTGSSDTNNISCGFEPGAHGGSDYCQYQADSSTWQLVTTRQFTMREWQ